MKMKYLILCTLVVLATAGKNRNGKSKEDKRRAKEERRQNQNKESLTAPFPSELPAPTGGIEFEPMFTTEVDLRITIPGTQELKERVDGLAIAQELLGAVDMGLEQQIYNVAVNAEGVDAMLNERITDAVAEAKHQLEANGVNDNAQHAEVHERIDNIEDMQGRQNEGLMLAASGLDLHESAIAETNSRLEELVEMGADAEVRINMHLGRHDSQIGEIAQAGIAIAEAGSALAQADIVALGLIKGNIEGVQGNREDIQQLTSDGVEAISQIHDRIDEMRDDGVDAFQQAFQTIEGLREVGEEAFEDVHERIDEVIGAGAMLEDDVEEGFEGVHERIENMEIVGGLALAGVQAEFAGVVEAVNDTFEEAYNDVQEGFDDVHGRVDDLTDDVVEAYDTIQGQLEDHAGQLVQMREDGTMAWQGINQRVDGVEGELMGLAAAGEGAIGALAFEIGNLEYAGEVAFGLVDQKFLAVDLELEVLELAGEAIAQGLGQNLLAVDAEVQALAREGAAAADALGNRIANVAEDLIDFKEDIDAEQELDEAAIVEVAKDVEGLRSGVAAANDSIYRRIDAESQARVNGDNEIVGVMTGIQEEVHGLTDIDFKQEQYLEGAIHIESEIQDEVEMVHKEVLQKVDQLKRSAAAAHDSLAHDMIIIEEQIREINPLDILEGVAMIEQQCIARVQNLERIVTEEDVSLSARMDAHQSGIMSRVGSMESGLINRISGLEQELNGAVTINNQQREKIVALEGANAAHLELINAMNNLIGEFDLRLRGQEQMILELKARPTTVTEIFQEEIDIHIVEEIIEQPIIEVIEEGPGFIEVMEPVQYGGIGYGRR